MTGELAAFLTARLDEDEAAAERYLAHSVWRYERALREIEAKREILRLHGRMSVQPGHPMFNDAHLTSAPMPLCRSCEPETMWRRERSWPCRTLRALAAVYSDHPDYRQEWKAS